MSKPKQDISDNWKLLIEDVVNGMSVSEACKKWEVSRQLWYNYIQYGQSPAHKAYYDGLRDKENPLRQGKPRRTDEITNESLTERAMQIVHSKLNDEKGKISDDLFNAAIKWLQVERHVKTVGDANDEAGFSGNFDKMIAMMEKQMGLKRGELTQRLAEADDGGK